jgi:peptidoglycan/xylan/chitin deacetylase (PgdA/CDA1 family)
MAVATAAGRSAPSTAGRTDASNSIKAGTPTATDILRVAMTVDDLPLVTGAMPRVIGVRPPLDTSDAAMADQVNARILRVFKSHHIPAVGFVNQLGVDQIGRSIGERTLRRWTAPGFDLGNHFYSHADANKLTIDAAEQEIIKGETSIRKVLAHVSRTPQFLRFPYNQTGESKDKHDALAAFIAERGYSTAPTTIDNEDFEFNRAYFVARLKGDHVMQAKIRAAYIDYTAAEIDWYSRLNKQVLGYAPPHIMLLHASPLNAVEVADVVRLFERRGYKFITLREALQDKAYSIPETFITKFGPMWGYRWARELNVKVNGNLEPTVPGWIDGYIQRGTDKGDRQ